MSNENLALWERVEKTDPKKTKKFKGKGGFSGTAIHPMYMIRRATEEWGPIGVKWGLRIIGQQLLEGAPIIEKDGKVIGVEKIHVVQCEVFHPGGTIPCFGQTQFCGKRNDGALFTDEEAPKKSLTDALTKGLSWLGFAADVHEGRFDDSKYLNQIMTEFEEKGIELARAKLRNDGMPILRSAAKQGFDALKAAVRTMSPEMVDACRGEELDRLKEEATRIKPAATKKEEANAGRVA